MPGDTVRVPSLGGAGYRIQVIESLLAEEIQGFLMDLLELSPIGF